MIAILGLIAELKESPLGMYLADKGPSSVRQVLERPFVDKAVTLGGLPLRLSAEASAQAGSRRFKVTFATAKHVLWVGNDKSPPFPNGIPLEDGRSEQGDDDHRNQ